MPSLSLSSSVFSLRSLLGSLIALPIIVIICVAWWLSASSVIENIHFANATDQILNIVATTRDFSLHDRNFATQPGDDLLAALTRVGLVADATKDDASPAKLLNPWHETVQATVLSPNAFRIEMVVPVRDCRRLAFFFARDAHSLGLQIMEASDVKSSLWRRFLESETSDISEGHSVEGACGEGLRAQLALVFKLR